MEVKQEIKQEITQEIKQEYPVKLETIDDDEIYGEVRPVAFPPMPPAEYGSVKNEQAEVDMTAADVIIE